MQNWCVLQDQRGIMYFGNNMGILEFDGISWKLYQVKNKSWVRSLAQDERGRIYVGANSEFGYLQTDKLGRLQYVSLLEKIPAGFRDFNDVWRTYVTSEGVVFQTFDNIFLYKNDQVSVLSKKQRFFYGFLANDRFYVKELGKRILFLENGELRPLAGSENFADDNFYAVLPFDKDSVLFAFRNHGLYLYHAQRTNQPVFEKLPDSGNADEFLRSNQLYCGAAMSDGLFAFGTTQDGALILNQKGEILQHLNRATGLQDSGVYHIFCDRDKNLWLGLANGIAYVESSSPFALMDHKLGIDGNGNGCYLETEKGTGSENALFLATGQNAYRRGKRGFNPTFQFMPGTANQNWGLQKFRGVLLSASREGICQIDEKLGTIKPLLAVNRNFFKFIPLRDNPDYLLGGAWDGFVLLSFENGSWRYQWPIEGYSLYGRYTEFDRQGHLWVCLENKGVYRMRLSGDMRRFEDVRLYGGKEGLPSDFGNRVYRLGEEIVFGTEKGVYRYDNARDSFYPDEGLNKLFNKDAPLFPFREDKTGNVWFQEGSEKGLLFKKNDGSYQLEKTPFYRIKRAKIEVAILPFDEGNVFFGVADGFIHYDPRLKKNYDVPFEALIREVTCSKDNTNLFAGTFYGKNNDLAVSQSEEQIPVLPYASNALRFSFAATFYESREDNEYSCFLDGFNGRWSDWSPKSEKEYTNLSEGKYTFQVKSRNIYRKESQTAVFLFTIQAPWYRTLPAYILYFLLGFTLVSAIVKVYTSRLQREKVRLEKLVIARTQELKLANEIAEKARAAAEAASQAKGMFLSRMSHEIRTPMNSVIGFSDMLLDTKMSEEQVEFVRNITKSGEALLSLINEILDFSKIEAGQMTFQSIDFDLEITAFDVCHITQPRLGNKPVEVFCRVDDNLPAFIKSDPTRLRQVLLNLISNAIKFTAAGEIELVIAIEEENEQQLKLHTTVRDTGIGIPADKLETVFELFQQVDGSITRKFGGTGLGLAICKQIARLMKGEVWVESELGKGSTFHFTAWVDKSEKMFVKQPQVEALAGKKALLVDDYESNLDILAHVVQLAGMRSESVRRGDEVLPALQKAIAAKAPFDICILDIQMPDMSGYEVSKQVRQQKDSLIANLKLLAFSSSVTKRIKMFKESGFDGFLPKPIQRHTLITMLKRLLGDAGEEMETEATRKKEVVITQHTLAEEAKHSVRILLAEDNPMNQKLAQYMLTKAGYQLEVANNGREAVEKYTAEPERFDLIFMDVHMPEMDGLEATKVLRNRGYMEIPIIAMTADAMKEDREKCLESGMNDYMAKPIKREEVFAMITKWVLESKNGH